MTTTLPSPEQLLVCLGQALKARNSGDAVALLRALAVVDPVSAETICAVIEALPARHGKERTEGERMTA